MDSVVVTRDTDVVSLVATRTILIIVFLGSVHLKRVAHNREFSLARRSLPYILRSAQTLFCVRIIINIKVLCSVDTEEYNLRCVPYKMCGCALMRNGLLRMQPNEKRATENRRSRAVLLRNVVLTAAN